MAERWFTGSRLVQSGGGSFYDAAPIRVVAYLRMRGPWLEQMGLEPGAGVRMETSPRRLVITPEERGVVGA